MIFIGNSTAHCLIAHMPMLVRDDVPGGVVGTMESIHRRMRWIWRSCFAVITRGHSVRIICDFNGSVCVRACDIQFPHWTMTALWKKWCRARKNGDSSSPISTIVCVSFFSTCSHGSLMSLYLSRHISTTSVSFTLLQNRGYYQYRYIL